MTRSNTRYTREFREEAVKLVLAQGITIDDASESLGMPRGTLANWVTAAKHGSDTEAAPVPGGRSVSELEKEVARLRKALAQAEMDREILKKAAAYFARKSLPGTRK